MDEVAERQVDSLSILAKGLIEIFHRLPLHRTPSCVASMLSILIP